MGDDTVSALTTLNERLTELEHIVEHLREFVFDSPPTEGDDQ